MRSLFGKSLTAPALLEMVEVIQTVLDSSTASDQKNAQARTFVASLPSVDRFTILTMFLNQREKDQVIGLLQRLGVAKNAWGL
jgi:hypothetical protein